jgi:hypothetical protein
MEQDYENALILANKLLVLKQGIKGEDSLSSFLLKFEIVKLVK